MCNVLIIHTIWQKQGNLKKIFYLRSKKIYTTFGCRVVPFSISGGSDGGKGSFKPLKLHDINNEEPLISN